MQKKCQDNNAAIRKVILDAAYKIGMEEGIEKITARRIGTEIGYSTGVIYYHFQNKQEILDILRQDRDKSIYEAVRECFHPDGGLRENCGRVMDYIYQFAVNERDFYIQIYTEQSAGDTQKDMWMDLIRNGLDIAVSRDELAPDKIESATNFLWSFFIGYDMLLLHHCPSNADAAREMSQSMLDVLMEGLLKR